jgi:histidyl-tRNA synthetase
MKDKNARTAIEQMRLLLHYCELMGVSESVRFEPSLARGLDYYTGVIFEAVIKGAALAHQVHSIAADYSGSSECVEPDADEPTDAGESQVGGVGSVAGGGRYDKLVGMFMGVGSRSGHEQDVPCVGVSLGIERLFAIMEMQQQQKSVRTTDTQVYVGSAHKKLVEERLKLARMLWAANIKVHTAVAELKKCVDVAD